MGNRLTWLIMVITLMLLPACMEMTEEGIEDTVDSDSSPATRNFDIVETNGGEAWSGRQETRYWKPRPNVICRNVSGQEVCEKKPKWSIVSKLLNTGITFDENHTQFCINATIKPLVKQAIKYCNSHYNTSHNKLKCIKTLAENKGVNVSRYNWSKVDFKNVPAKLKGINKKFDIWNGYYNCFNMPTTDGEELSIGFGTEYWDTTSECVIDSDQNDSDKEIIVSCDIIVNNSATWRMVNVNLTWNVTDHYQYEIQGKSTAKAIYFTDVYESFDSLSKISLSDIDCNFSVLRGTDVSSYNRKNVGGSGTTTCINDSAYAGSIYANHEGSSTFNIKNSNFSSYSDWHNHGVINFTLPVSKVDFYYFRPDDVDVYGYVDFEDTKEMYMAGDKYRRHYPVCAYNDSGVNNIGSGWNMSLYWNGTLQDSVLTDSDGCGELEYEFITTTDLYSLNITVNGTYYRNNIVIHSDTNEEDSGGTVKGIVLENVTIGAADSTEPSISAEAINDTEIEVNQSIKLNCTVSDDTAVDIVKFYIEPFGNITATDADPEFYIICNASNPCNTTVEGQYNWTWVWANDTTNNINSTVVTLNYTVVTTTTTTTTTTVPLHLAFQTPTPANDTTITVNHVEVNISVENLSNPLDTFIFSWNNTNMTLRNFNCTDQNMSFINDGEGGFCIDKYEASCWNTDGSWNSTSATDEWRAVNTTAALTGGAYAGSSPGKYPWVYVNQTQARTACENAGKQLCTSEQWLAAANINGTFYDLPEIITDCNVVSGSPAECQNTGPDGGDACNTSYMSDCVSEEGVYDMIGNVWEWCNESFTVVIPLATSSWHRINTTSMDWSLSSSADDGKYGKDGCYFATAGGYTVIRGGPWDHETYAGPFCASLAYVPYSTDNAIGFRCCAAPNDPSDVPSTWENISEVYYNFTPVKIASSLTQHNSSEWRFYYNETNISDGTYTYYGWANDTTGNFNRSEIRTITLGVIAEIEDAVETILNVIRWGWD